MYLTKVGLRQSNEIRRGRHCVFAMHVHLVFVAKYRKKVFDAEILKSILPFTIKKFRGKNLIYSYMYRSI